MQKIAQAESKSQPRRGLLTYVFEIILDLSRDVHIVVVENKKLSHVGFL